MLLWPRRRKFFAGARLTVADKLIGNSTGLPVGTERWWCRALDERAAPDRGLTGLRVVGATDAVSDPMESDYVRRSWKH